jgi:hypothetical protein
MVVFVFVKKISAAGNRGEQAKTKKMNEAFRGRQLCWCSFF